MAISTTPATSEQIERANATGLTPVVFIHGLWLLGSSWNRSGWREVANTALAFVKRFA